MSSESSTTAKFQKILDIGHHHQVHKNPNWEALRGLDKIPGLVVRKTQILEEDFELEGSLEPNIQWMMFGDYKRTYVHLYGGPPRAKHMKWDYDRMNRERAEEGSIMFSIKNEVPVVRRGPEMSTCAAKVFDAVIESLGSN